VKRVPVTVVGLAGVTFPERWDDLSPETRDAILRVSAGELTADEARKELQEQGDED
jgi:hypothetical protein